jgi:S-formylglutathione hydrolase FrmB
MATAVMVCRCYWWCRRPASRFSTVARIEDFDLVGQPFLLTLGAVALVLVVLAAFWTPHRKTRWLLSVVATVAVLATLGAGINGHFAYIRTLGQAFGGITGNVVGAEALGERCSTAPDEGSLVKHHIPGSRSGFDGRPAWLYFPPAWCLDDSTEYPVLFLLHGIPGRTQDWINSGLANKTADAFAAEHDGKAPVIVMPPTGGSSDTECVDSDRYGNIETYLVEDVPDYLDDAYGDRLADRPDAWAVGGLSMGATCAIMLTLRHPDVFHTFADYSGEDFGIGSRAATVRTLFDGDEQAFDRHDPAKLMAEHRYAALGGWFEVGGDDGAAVDDVEAYQRAAARAGMTTCLVVVPDQGHTFVLWAKAFEQSLPWLAARTGMIDETEEMTEPCQRTS